MARPRVPRQDNEQKVWKALHRLRGGEGEAAQKKPEEESDIPPLYRRLRDGEATMPTRAQVGDAAERSERWASEFWPAALDDAYVTSLIDAGWVGSRDDAIHNAHVLADMGWSDRQIADFLFGGIAPWDARPPVALEDEEEQAKADERNRARVRRLLEEDEPKPE